MKLCNNCLNKKTFGVTVDNEGREVNVNTAIERGLVTKTNALHWGLLVNRENGVLTDREGIFGGGQHSVVGRIEVTWEESDEDEENDLFDSDSGNETVFD